MLRNCSAFCMYVVTKHMLLNHFCDGKTSLIFFGISLLLVSLVHVITRHFGYITETPMLAITYIYSMETI